MRTLKRDDTALRDRVSEMEQQLSDIDNSSRRQIERANQKAQLAQDALGKCKEDLRRTQQDLGYKRAALNRAQEMNSEYDAELRELRTLKEESADAEILKRDLSGHSSKNHFICRSHELY
jgi:DNA repair exonuclease SbcCD ATPase subunit